MNNELDTIYGLLAALIAPAFVIGAGVIVAVKAGYQHARNELRGLKEDVRHLHHVVSHFKDEGGRTSHEDDLERLSELQIQIEDKLDEIALQMARFGTTAYRTPAGPAVFETKLRGKRVRVTVETIDE